MRRTATLIILLLLVATSASAMILAGVMSSYNVPKPPNAPTGVTATAGSAQNTVDWTASAVDSTHDAATSYTLYGGTSASPTTSIYTGSATSYTDTGLTPGIPYYYRATASNISGTSGYSSPDATATPSAGLTTSGIILQLNAAKGNGTSAPNGTTPTAWTDISGNGLTATLSYGTTTQTPNASWTSGTPNVANFASNTDAVHLHAAITRSATLEPNFITVEMVFKQNTVLSSFNGGYPVLLKKYNAYGNNAGYGLFYDQGAGKLVWRVYADSAWQDVNISPSAWANDTTNYHHLVCTWDGRYSRVYMDGTEILNGGNPWVDLGAGANYAIVANTASNLTISGGTDGTTWSGHSNINLSVLRIYNRALTSSEVSANYANKYATN